MTGSPPRPCDEELRAFARGALPPDRFGAVDAWLGTLPDDEQDRLLEEVGTLGGMPAPGIERTGFVGATRAGRYVTLETIGDGGMGVVRLVRDEVLDRDVAIKACRQRLPHQSVVGHNRLRRQLEHEARIMSGLEHPGIVPVHEIGHDEAGEPAFVMPRLDGVALDRFLVEHAAEDELPLADRVRIMLQVTEAIAFAHSHGVVHRDLKPENVIIGEFGNVTVIDWGLATPVAGADDGAVAGTPLWMPPEQHRGRPPDLRMDVWALGALLQYAVIGAYPRSQFDDSGRSGIVREELPAGLRAVVARCLRDEPEARYADAGAVADELRRWLAGGITRAQRPGPLRRLTAWLRTHRPLAAALSVLVLAILAGGVWFAVDAAIRRQRAETAIARLLADLPVDDREGLLRSRRLLADLAAEADDMVRADAHARIDMVLEMLDHQDLLDRQCRRLQELAARYTATGPWPTETRDRWAVLVEIGFGLQPDSVAEDADLLADHPLQDCLIEAVILLQRSALLGDAPAADRLAAVVPDLIERSGAVPAAAALARIYADSSIGTHQLELPPDVDADLQLVLTEPGCADLLLQSHRPGPHLVAHAQARVEARPDAFWPRVVLSRIAFAAADHAAARRHGLVALGRHAASIWSRLVLAYAAMGSGAHADLVAHARAGRELSPRNLELLVLEAVGLARSGRLPAAQELIDGANAHPHFRYHLERPAGHPMDLSVHALVEAGVEIPPGPAEIGPRTPADEL